MCGARKLDVRSDMCSHFPDPRQQLSLRQGQHNVSRDRVAAGGAQILMRNDTVDAALRELVDIRRCNVVRAKVADQDGRGKVVDN